MGDHRNIVIRNRKVVEGCWDVDKHRAIEDLI